MGSDKLLQLSGGRVTVIRPASAIPAGARLAVDGPHIIHYALDQSYEQCVLESEFEGAYRTLCSELRELKAWRGGSLHWCIVFDGLRPEWKLAKSLRDQIPNGAIPAPADWDPQESGAWEESRAHAKAVGARARQLAHRLSIDFIPRALAACAALGVKKIVAPAESDHQVSATRLPLICTATRLAHPG